MKIVFLCSSLEPGRDGVGDYTRLLAGECMRQGHLSCVIALHDSHLQVPVNTQGDIMEWRFPTVMPWSERIANANAILNDFDPDWVSLQFVPYGFHKKGLIFGLERRLRALTSHRKCHLMFHELWIGASIGSTIKEKAIGLIQRYFILNMVKRIQPQIIHTSNYSYIGLLKRCRVSANLLPLYGNIPITTNTDFNWIISALQQAGIEISSQTRDDYWLGGFFGALHLTWPPEPLLTELIAAAEQRHRKLVLICIGRLGAGTVLWQTIARKYTGKINFCALGEKSKEEVSQFLQYVDFGVASSPFSLIGKSGSASAMLEHGLPVIVNRDDVHFATVPVARVDSDPLLHKMDEKLPGKLYAGLTRMPPCGRLKSTATKLLQVLMDNTKLERSEHDLYCSR